MCSLCVNQGMLGGRLTQFYMMRKNFTSNTSLQKFPFLSHLPAAVHKVTHSKPNQGTDVALLQLPFGFLFSRRVYREGCSHRDYCQQVQVSGL